MKKAWKTLFPHQKMSGTGSDSLGNWELRAGRRYTSAHNIEWVKTYTALRAAYAQLDPTKLAEATSSPAGPLTP